MTFGPSRSDARSPRWMVRSSAMNSVHSSGRRPRAVLLAPAAASWSGGAADPLAELREDRHQLNRRLGQAAGRPPSRAPRPRGSTGRRLPAWPRPGPASRRRTRPRPAADRRCRPAGTVYDSACSCPRRSRWASLPHADCTLWASSTAADGAGSRPSAARTWSRNASWMSSHTLGAQEPKPPIGGVPRCQIVLHQPPRTTGHQHKRIVSMTSRWPCFNGRAPRGRSSTGRRPATSSHIASVRAQG